MSRTQIPGSQIKDETIQSADILNDTIINADINSAAAIEVSKIDYENSTIIGAKATGGNVHLTVAETRALIGVENPVDYVISLPIDYELSDKGKMARYNNVLYIWNGIIWEESVRPTWYKRIAIPARTKAANTSNEWRMPSDPLVNLPFVGDYQIDVFVNFVEWETPPSIATQSCIAPQTLSIRSGIGGPLIPIDKSGNISVIGVATPPKWYNWSLQGSIILNIADNDGDKSFFISLDLPNSNWDEIIGGFVHIEYLGNTEGNY